MCTVGDSIANLIYLRTVCTCYSHLHIGLHNKMHNAATDVT